MSMKPSGNSRPLRIHVPLDASDIEQFKPDIPVKVIALGAGDRLLGSATTELDAKGKGRVTLVLAGNPAGARLVVGPADASDEELARLQTITRAISVRAASEREFEVPAIVISPYYWAWWLRWCRTFVIRGRVVCPDGSPVPGATVCAYDVDWWWWWSSTQQVGCATTDASGAFTLKFRWCCGWWPSWWWKLRYWQLEPALVERIRPHLERTLPKLPVVPSPRPSLALFDDILGGERNARALPGAEVDVAALPALRDRLVAKLPATADLAQLRIWPWRPWQPWWDCSPDIIFKVRQRCGGEERLIIDEGYGDTRWDIPTSLNVTLTADDNACCVQDPPPPEGNCLVLSSVCSNLVSGIGGNPGAAAAPIGYLNPGSGTTSSDRPYAGNVPISGIFGNTANIDYYEFEWAQAPGGPWNAMPPAAAGGFSRWFWGPALPAGPVNFHAVPVPFQVVGGRLVAESREHFEATQGPGSWGFSRFWVSNRDLLMQWLTAASFADGTYYLRLVGYAAIGPNTLGPRQILPLCDTKDDNGLAITIDNATSTLEPAADIVDVRINGASAGPCSNVDASKGGSLEVDFVAYDIDRHLALYSLIATYGENLAVDLLAAAGATLTPVVLGAIPAADFVGPTYGAAQGQGATPPHWRAGGLRLTIPDLRHAFPETCCYQIELRVYKRTVVSCDYDFTPNKLSYYSLTVVV